MSSGSGSTTATPSTSTNNLYNPGANYTSGNQLPSANNAAYSGASNLASNTASASGYNPAWGNAVGQEIGGIGGNVASLGQSVNGVGSNVLSTNNSAGLPGYANQALQTGFDPQGALYARTLQQTTDAQNAQNAANGVSMTPYGAGLQDQNVSNFNIDWQNQALQRQQTGAATANSLLGQYDTGAQTGANIQATGGGLQSTGAGLLSTGAQTSQGAGTYASNLLQQQFQDLMGYTSAGDTANLNYDSALVNLFGQGTQAQKNVDSASSSLGSGIGDVAGLAAAMMFL